MSIVPLHIVAIESQEDLLVWIRLWCPTRILKIFSPANWYVRGHNVVGYTRNWDQTNLHNMNPVDGDKVNGKLWDISRRINLDLL